jgi:hypothetical protein
MEMFWPKLIDYWCNEHYGLTLPFIVGAEQLMAKRENYDIEKLLEEIKDSDNNYVITLCSDLEEHIIGTHKKEYPPFGSLKNYGSLFLYDTELENEKDFSSLNKYLSDKYSNYIMDGNFSKNYYTEKWCSFDEEDLINLNHANQ